MSDSAESIRQYVANGDQSPFSQIVHDHINLVYSVALRQVCGDTHLAEDVTQEVFIVLSRKARSVAGRATLNGWLHHTAILASYAAIRREQRRRWREQRAQTEAAIMGKDASDSQSEVDWKEVRRVLDKAIGRLTERERDAVILRFFENHSFPEIGKILKLSESAARMRVERALEKLRNSLARGRVAPGVAGMAPLLAELGATAAPAGLLARVSGALTAASTTGSGAAGVRIWSFMSSTKAAVGVAGLLILAVGSAVYETLQAHWIPRELAVSNRAYDDLQNTYQAAQGRLLQTAPARASAKTEPTPPRAISSGQNWLIEKLASDPAFQQQFINNQTAQMRLRALPSMRTLGLTPEEFERLMGLMEQKEWTVMDIYIADYELGYPASDQETHLLILKANMDMMSAMQAEVGISTMLAMKKYADSYDAQSPLVQGLAAALYDTGTPLTSAQAKGLGEVVAASNVPIFEIDWNEALAKGNVGLAPQQQEALHSVSEVIQFGASIKLARINSQVKAVDR